MNPQTVETVRAHLKEIFASKAFASSPRLRHFLTFVVEKTLTGESDQIKEFLVASEVYGRGAEYDPQVDSTVRVEANRLRGKLRLFYSDVPADASVRIDLPKGSYVPVFHLAEVRQEEPQPQQQVPWKRYAAPLTAVCTLLLGAMLMI